MSNAETGHGNQTRSEIHLKIRAALLDEAKALNLNTSRAAESGIEAAVQRAKSKAWIQDNKQAIKAHNARIEKLGPLLRPYWVQDEDGTF